MPNDLQREYQLLLKELEEAKGFLIRAETNLEQKQRELDKSKLKLKELTTLDDTSAIVNLLADIDVELTKLVDEAKALFAEVNSLE